MHHTARSQHRSGFGHALTSSVDTTSRRMPFRRLALGCASAAVVLLLAFPGAALADVMATEGQEFSGSVAPSGGCAFVGATVDWGDGTTSEGGLTQDGTEFTGTHTYAEEGTYNGSVAYTCPSWLARFISRSRRLCRTRR